MTIAASAAASPLDCAETPRRRYPPPSNLIYPPTPWGRWQAVFRVLEQRLRREIAPDDLRGAFRAVAIMRQLLELVPTPDNFGKPVLVQREPGDDSDEEDAPW